jgi:Mg-chelatase subunit ChlD
MDQPKFFYQTSDEYPGQVAVMAQFMPTFDSKEEEMKGNEVKTCSIPDDLERTEIDESYEIDESNEIDSEGFQFTFIVDRSGSMGCYNRMEITRAALKLFMSSLPFGCKFNIVSFGSSFKSMYIEYQ